jgi:hypothetical protein
MLVLVRVQYGLSRLSIPAREDPTPGRPASRRMLGDRMRGDRMLEGARQKQDQQFCGLGWRRCLVFGRLAHSRCCLPLSGRSGVGWDPACGREGRLVSSYSCSSRLGRGMGCPPYYPRAEYAWPRTSTGVSIVLGIGNFKARMRVLSRTQKTNAPIHGGFTASDDAAGSGWRSSNHNIPGAGMQYSARFTQ